MKETNTQILKDIRTLLKLIGVTIAILIVLQTVQGCELVRGDDDAELKLSVYSNFLSERRIQVYAYRYYRIMTRVEPYKHHSIAVYKGLCDDLDHNDVRVYIDRNIKLGRAYNGLEGRYSGRIRLGTRGYRDKDIFLHELGHAYSLSHNNVYRSCMSVYNARCRYRNTYLDHEVKQIEGFI